MTNAIEVRGLCKDYGDFQLRDVDLTLPGGSILGLIGENGAGKSTTIKAILGLIRRNGGSIRIFGREILGDDPSYKEDIGVVLDEASFHDPLKVPQVGRVLSGVYRDWDSARFDAYVERFRLPRDKKIKEFSRGMKQKLSIATALSHHPRLLILDEATSGLDPVVRDEILDEFLAFICDEEHAILISSHITSDLEKAADYITYIHQGRVVLSEAKDTILDNYGRLGCTAAQLEGVDPADLLRVRKNSFGCEALVPDRRAFRRKYPALTVDRVTLEDIMLFIGKGEAA